MANLRWVDDCIVVTALMDAAVVASLTVPVLGWANLHV